MSKKRKSPRRIVAGKQIVVDEGGRQSMLELDDDIEGRILNALRIGASVSTATAFQGLCYDTVRYWVLRGKEDPSGRYGQFISRVHKAIAEWEMRDLSVIDAHAHGRPAQYMMDPVRDSEGNLVYESPGKPLMQIARDADGNPILKSEEIKSDWRAAMERMSRRMPRYWSRRDQNSLEIDGVMTLDNKKADSKEAMTFDERVRAARKRVEEDI